MRAIFKLCDRVHAMAARRAWIGIDGYLHCRVADKKPRFALISVKGGGIKSGDIRDPKGTMEREKAALGLFLFPHVIDATRVRTTCYRYRNSARARMRRKCRPR